MRILMGILFVSIPAILFGLVTGFITQSMELAGFATCIGFFIGCDVLFNGNNK